MRRKADKLALVALTLAILSAVTVIAVSVTVLDTSSRTARNAASVQQVCDLVINVHTDKVRQYVNTIEYLKNPIATERGLNDYIRERSLPQTFAEVTKERENLPATCVTGRRLPAIPPLP